MKKEYIAGPQIDPKKVLNATTSALFRTPPAECLLWKISETLLSLILYQGRSSWSYQWEGRVWQAEMQFGFFSFLREENLKIKTSRILFFSNFGFEWCTKGFSGILRLSLVCWVWCLFPDRLLFFLSILYGSNNDIDNFDDKYVFCMGGVVRL